MSAEMLQCVFEDASVTSLADRIVLIAIAWKYDPRKGCFPSIDMLVAMTVIDRATVYRALSRLEKAGKITIKHGGKGQGDRNYYTPAYTPKPKSLKIIEANFSQQERDGTSPAEERGAPIETAVEDNGKKAPKTARAKKSKRLNLDAVQFPEGFDTPELRAAITGWAEARKIPPTNHACDLALAKFAGLGVETAISQFNHSAECAWSGVFLPKQDQRRFASPQPAQKTYKTV